MKPGHKIHTQHPYVEAVVPLANFMHAEATRFSLLLRCNGSTTLEARLLMKSKIDLLILELNAMLEEL